MRIAVIGTGRIGANAARLFVGAGHDVVLANSRGPASLQPLVDRLGSHATAATVDEAAGSGEIVLLAVPWRTPDALPASELVAGKIVVDAMNPYTEAFTLIDLGDSTSSERTQQRLPGARLVKAFNTIHFQHLATMGRTGLPLEDRIAIYVAGDDPHAKAVVAGLIEEIGFTPVDTGTLHEGGKRQEPGSPIYNRPMTAREAREVVAGLPPVG